MFFRWQQYTDLPDRAAGRRRSDWFGDHPAYDRHHTAVGLAQSSKYAKLTSCIFDRHEQLQRWIVAALKGHRASVPSIRGRSWLSHRVEGDRHCRGPTRSRRRTRAVVNLQLPEAEYDHCRRQPNAEGDDQSLFEPGQL
jgi:hypothetical protein